MTGRATHRNADITASRTTAAVRVAKDNGEGHRGGGIIDGEGDTL